MDYKILTIENPVIDFNTYRHVGWKSDDLNSCITGFYSIETVNLISKKITELTKGVDKQNRSIIVPNQRIAEVMDGVYRNFRPPTSDIFSRYNIENNEQTNIVQSLIDQTIEIITSNIKNQLGMEQNNQTLSAWVQVYGNFNPHNLTQHAPIKIKEKRIPSMQFNMNY